MAHLDWLSTAHRAPETIRNRRSILKRFAHWIVVAGWGSWTDLTKDLVAAYQADLVRAVRLNGQPLTLGTRYEHLVALRGFLRWLAERGLSQPACETAITLPRRPFQLPRGVLPLAMVEGTLALPDTRWPHGLRDRAILELFYATGLRRLELIRLQLSDIWMDRGAVLVRGGKGGRDRVVPVAERSLIWVERYRVQARPAFLGVADPGFLFLSRHGNPMRGNRLSERVRRYLVAAGAPEPGSCHRFRHTMATHLLDGGADIRHIQALLGHSQLSTTALYAQVSLTGLREVYRRAHPAARVGPDEPLAPGPLES